MSAPATISQSERFRAARVNRAHVADVFAYIADLADKLAEVSHTIDADRIDRAIDAIAAATLEARRAVKEVGMIERGVRK